MKILICGSREASSRLLKIAGEFVQLYHEHEFICGDAEGVDAAVIQACDALGVPITVYGANNQLRHQTQTGRNIALGGSYRMRDAWMVAQQPDVVIGLWNGTSAGTLATVKHAKRQGILSSLVR
jgi:hypothetical protein